MIPEHVTALIFDCDGTLADTMPAHFRAWSATVTPLGLHFPEERFYSLGGMPSVRIVEMLCREQGITLDVAAAAAAKELAFMQHLENVQPIPPVVDIARGQFGKRPMAVASGGYRHIVSATLVKLGVADWFSVVVTAEDTPRHKPDPDVFLEAARRLEVPAEECMVFEDTDIGLEAARRAGMAAFDVRSVFAPVRVGHANGHKPIEFRKT